MMLTDKKMLKDVSKVGSLNPYYELVYFSGSDYVTLSIIDYDKNNHLGHYYSVYYEAESAKEAQEIYDEGTRWLTKIDREIEMDNIGLWSFPTLKDRIPKCL